MPIAEVVKGIHDVTIVAQNVAELRQFYAALGFPQVVDRPNELAVFLIGSNELAIHTAPTRPTQALVLSLLVTDLEPIERTALELGLPITGPATMRPGLLGVALHDPNGNKLEFLTPEK
jgi:catechol 2,3-dioxygenase-like lactoylglutathione lyase family enzyme